MKWKEKLKEDWYRDNYFPIQFEKDEEWERMDRNADIIYGYIKRFAETPREEWISVEEQDKLWDEAEDIFDKNTSPTGGGYEADYTYKGGFFSEMKSKFLIIPHPKINYERDTEI